MYSHHKTGRAARGHPHPGESTRVDYHFFQLPKNYPNRFSPQENLALEDARQVITAYEEEEEADILTKRMSILRQLGSAHVLLFRET